MTIAGAGWELHLSRKSEQRRSDGRIRTIGTYQVFHDGVAQYLRDLHGATAESCGPSANGPSGCGTRIRPGRYPLATQDGSRYATWGYSDNDKSRASRKPAFELRSTGERSEILVHPGQGFLSSIGCINPCTLLPSAHELITYASSRRRVISLIEDMKTHLGNAFPDTNGHNIPSAFVVIDEDEFIGL